MEENISANNIFVTSEVKEFIDFLAKRISKEKSSVSSRVKFCFGRVSISNIS